MATLPDRPSLEHLKNQAKRLLKSAKAQHPEALNRVGPYFGDPARITLQQAQLVIARDYGFSGWARRKHPSTGQTAFSIWSACITAPTRPVGPQILTARLRSWQPIPRSSRIHPMSPRPAPMPPRWRTGWTRIPTWSPLPAPRWKQGPIPMTARAPITAASAPTTPICS